MSYFSVERQGLEANGNKGLLRRWRFHTKTTKIWAIYSANG